MTDESEADIVGAGPFAVLGNGANHIGREFFAREDLEDLCFGEIGIVQNYGEHLSVAFREERAGDARGPTPREGNLLP